MQLILKHVGNDANPEHGAFARYIAVKGDIQFRIPDKISFDAACTVGVGLTTLGYALYKVLQLPWPGAQLGRESNPILIYGGSTATGTLAIQFAKRSGLRVLATGSPKNFQMLKIRGADAVFDYHDKDIGQQLRVATNGRLSRVLDCVSTPETAKICADAIGPSGGKYCSLLDGKSPRSDVESTFFLSYSASGEPYIFEDEHYEADSEYFEHAMRFAEEASMLWTAGKWEPHPHNEQKGGLRAALEGMAIMRAGRYSGERLVYRVDETDWP